MKVRLYREGTGSKYAREQRALFDELDPVPACFLQLVDKRYSLKLFAHGGEGRGGRGRKKEKQKEKKIIPFRRNLLGSVAASVRSD